MIRDIRSLIFTGDLPRLRDIVHSAKPDINAYDHHGRTPLMDAVTSPKASVELVKFLLANGADLHLTSRGHYEKDHTVVGLAVKAGDPDKVALLVDNGANLRYAHPCNYDAFIEAACGDGPRLNELLKLLIAHGLPLNAASTHNETALGRLSRNGRFEAIRLLLDAGADPAPLQWTPLHHAIAFGSLEDVRTLIKSGANLEEVDSWDRTPFLLAVHTGDVAKAELLLTSGAKSRGLSAEPVLFYAIQREEMLRWLIGIGAGIDQADDFGATALTEAVDADNSKAVRVLLGAGADLERECCGQTALGRAASHNIITQLLDAGADPRRLTCGGQRLLVGLGESSEDPLFQVTEEQFRAGCSPRFGTANAERMSVPVWDAMIRSGVSAYQGAQICMGKRDRQVRPVWCADRNGQSLTRLPDGRLIQIGGEHEDSYDEDFCIYNDVFVHHADGTIDIYGYPEDVFPPTDFHSATLVGGFIYIIGSIGYYGTRRFGETPVYRLNIDTLRIERVDTTGANPGWISHHRSELLSATEIRVSDGKVSTHDGRKELYHLNDKAFVLDITQLAWRRV